MVEILVEILQELQLYGELALNKFESVAKCDEVVFLSFDLCLVEIPVVGDPGVKIDTKRLCVSWVLG